MLNRIAKALNQQVQVVMRPKQREIETVRLAFREVIRGMRKEQGLSLEQLGRKIDASTEELAELEQDSTCRPTPLILHKLSRFFEIPQRKLALLAGAIKDIPIAFCQQASSFAAQSESFSRLTSEERKLLDEFVKFLRTEIKQE
jgi:transcriptional regulator with XRE-family HTH domain